MDGGAKGEFHLLLYLRLFFFSRQGQSKDVENIRPYLPVHCDAGSLLSVVVHSQETDIEDVHETIPKAANFRTARLAVTVRLQFKDALGECRQEILHLAL
jgi:hypothetical protein